MKASELRIGNIISRKDLGDNSNRIEQILELSRYKITTTGPTRVITYSENIHPIPLTPEWLERFSIVKLKTVWYGYNQYKMHFDSFGNLAFYDDMAENLTYLRSLEYVHQLQNLYFALTGRELELKQ